jgi:IS1 family transposase
MNKLTNQERAQVVAALVEGASINSVVRMTGISKPTILKLLVDLGTACKKYQDEKLRNLPCKRVQCDEIWSFCFAKDKNVPEKLRGQFGFGSVWTWTALCADTKLMVNWLVGNRDGDTACTFIDDLASRLAHRVQLSTDGHKPYLEAVENRIVNIRAERTRCIAMRQQVVKHDIALRNVAGLPKLESPGTLI